MARYAHQPFSEIRMLSRTELHLVVKAIEEILEKENPPIDGGQE